ncbi:HK97-gp10 family putative phage morphogenesis protein [Clostridium tyrobutyricum]|uniref:HK97-gp10 family putative phage morphogenesis protein n=1 Tax=Clostridium tyrobutyricum TaxID=1519 RepID=UPI0039F6A4E5
MSSDIKVEGMSELIEKLEAKNARFNTIENRALKLGAEPILEDMKNTNSFKNRSGNLKKALAVGKIKTKNGVKSIKIGVSGGDNSSAYYGKFVEFGTSKMPAKPFIEPAFEKHKGEVIEIIKQEIKGALK